MESRGGGEGCNGTERTSAPLCVHDTLGELRLEVWEHPSLAVASYNLIFRGSFSGCGLSDRSKSGASKRISDYRYQYLRGHQPWSLQVEEPSEPECESNES